MGLVRAPRVLLVCIILLLPGARVLAQQFTVQGNASQLAPDIYRLTPPSTTQAGMVTNFYSLDLTTNFNLDFEINLGATDANGADGMAFMLSKSCSPILTNGGGLGVVGIPNSIVVEFDTYDNSAPRNDIPQDHTGIYKDGDLTLAGNIMDAATLPVCLSTSCANVEDGLWHTVRIAWDYTDATTQKISVYFDGVLRTSSTGNHITNRFLGATNVFWSVSGSTGALFNDQQLKYAGPNTDVTICAGNNFTLTAPALGSNYTWTANASTTNTATYTAAGSGIYSCNFTDFCSINRTINFTVTVTALPQVNQVQGNGPVCPGSDAVFTITGNPGNIITYTLNGGPPQTITIGAGGTATVTVTAPATPQTINVTQAVNGTCSLPVSGQQATVNFSSLPAMPTVNGNGPICALQDAVFTIQSQPGYTITYQLNGGASQSATANAGGIATVTVPAATTDHVITLLTVSNGACALPGAGVTHTIVVKPLPVHPTVTSNDPICAGSDAVFTFNGDAGSSIFYTINGSGVQQVILNAAGNGTVTVNNPATDQLLTVTQAVLNGCALPVNDISVTVQVKPMPVVPVITGPASVCAGSNAQLIVTGDPGATCTWQLNGGAAQQLTIGASGQGLINLPSVTVPQQVLVTDITLNGCSRTLAVSFRVDVRPLKTSTITQSICEGTSFEGHTTSGTYVEVFTAANGCDSTRTLILTVDVPDKPSLGSDLYICPGQTITLNPGTFTTYLWQDGSTAPVFTATAPGIYTVAVSTACGFYNDAISVLKGKCDVYFPSAFSPNGDGLNDQFHAITDLWLKEYNLKVYNRYGQLIFESSDARKGWDGTYRGQKQDSGLFVWMSSYTNSLGIAKTLKGTVMLIR